MAALALYFMYYNFVRINQTLRVTPSMAAGVTGKLWSIEDVVKLTETHESEFKVRKPQTDPLAGNQAKSPTRRRVRGCRAGGNERFASDAPLVAPAAILGRRHSHQFPEDVSEMALVVESALERDLGQRGVSAAHQARRAQQPAFANKI